MVRVYPVGISPEHQNSKSLIFNSFRSLARYTSHSGDIAFKEICTNRPRPDLKRILRIWGDSALSML